MTKKQALNERKENSVEELNEMEASKLSEEFRVMIIRILNSMKKRYRNHKKDLSNIKNAISEIIP